MRIQAFPSQKAYPAFPLQRSMCPNSDSAGAHVKSRTLDLMQSATPEAEHGVGKQTGFQAPWEHEDYVCPTNGDKSWGPQHTTKDENDDMDPFGRFVSLKQMAVPPRKKRWRRSSTNLPKRRYPYCLWVKNAKRSKMDTS